VAGWGGTIGRRYVSCSSPICAIAALTGIGFDSAKFASMRGRSRAWISRADAKSFASAASTRRAISPGTTFDATETTPRAPTAIAGSVIASSPDRTMKPGGAARQTSQIWVMLPEASFTPTTFGRVARRERVAGSTLQPVRPGTLYTTMGSGVASPIAL
jgi:hypothetical protein